MAWLPMQRFKFNGRQPGAPPTSPHGPTATAGADAANADASTPRGGEGGADQDPGPSSHASSSGRKRAREALLGKDADPALSLAAASPTRRGGALLQGAPRGVPEKLGDRPLRLVIVGYVLRRRAWACLPPCSLTTSAPPVHTCVLGRARGRAKWGWNRGQRHYFCGQLLTPAWRLRADVSYKRRVRARSVAACLPHCPRLAFVYVLYTLRMPYNVQAQPQRARMALRALLLQPQQQVQA